MKKDVKKMTATTTVARWGNSCALRIPADMLTALHLGPRDRVTLETDEDRLIIKKDELRVDDGIHQFFGIFSGDGYDDFMEAISDTERVDVDEW